MIKQIQILFGLCLFISPAFSQISGQSVLYDYDTRGNEVKRYVYFSGNKKGDNTELVQGSIGISPNPASSFVNVNADTILSKYPFDIYTLDGRFVGALPPFDEGNVRLDVSSYANGTYFLYTPTNVIKTESPAKFIVIH